MFEKDFISDPTAFAKPTTVLSRLPWIVMVIKVDTEVEWCARSSIQAAGNVAGSRGQQPLASRDARRLP